MNHATSHAVTIVIPCFNEQAGIAHVIHEISGVLMSQGYNAEILVVDDGSTDSSAAEAKAAGSRVVRHRSNRGYGAALKTGIAAATHSVIVIADGDGTYPASAIPELLRMLESSDMVVGMRRMSGGNIPLVRRPAKWVLNRLANYVVGANIPDLNSGLRAFRKEMVQQYLHILPDQFSFTTTITLAMHCDKYAVRYVPIEYRSRTGKSKIVPWDAGSFLVLILRTTVLFRPLRVFLPLCLLCLGYGVLKSAQDLTHQIFISSSAILGFVSALMILLVGMLADVVVTRLGRLDVRATSAFRDEDTLEHD
jgi:glycosyltransferase involved in cell wall biosynthesis